MTGFVVASAVTVRGVIESPRELHTTVKSELSNASHRLEPSMNDAVELWSTPWHALQRRLANGWGVDESIRSHGSTLAPRTAPHAASSWLVRARHAAPRPFVQHTD